MTTLKQVKKIKTNTYKVNSEIYKDFYIDIVDKGDIFDVYLYHETIGVKEFMFGWPKHQTADNSFYTLDDMIDMVAGNLENQPYITSYIDEHILVD